MGVTMLNMWNSEKKESGYIRGLNNVELCHWDNPCSEIVCVLSSVSWLNWFSRFPLFSLKENKIIN